MLPPPPARDDRAHFHPAIVSVIPLRENRLRSRYPASLQLTSAMTGIWFDAAALHMTSKDPSILCLIITVRRNCLSWRNALSFVTRMHFGFILLGMSKCGNSREE